MNLVSKFALMKRLNLTWGQGRGDGANFEADVASVEIVNRATVILRRWAPVVATLLFTVFLNLILSERSIVAYETHAYAMTTHEHAMTQRTERVPSITRNALMRHSMAAFSGSPTIAPGNTGCPEHGGEKPVQKSGQCCGMACCAMTLANVGEFELVLVDQRASHTLLSMQFVPVGLIFGLNRPPDFLS